LSLHRDESVHKPQQDSCCNNRENDGGKWHIVCSPIISRMRYSKGSSRSYGRLTHFAWEPSERGERLLRFTSILLNRWGNSCAIMLIRQNEEDNLFSVRIQHS
jgi:hypothetical protein